MDLLTTAAAAMFLGMTPDTVRYHERRGHLLAIRVDNGRRGPLRLFVREDLERFRRERTVQPPAGQREDVHVEQEQCPSIPL
jgi:DNA-binding transcriptional MerR regulator